MKKHPRKLQRWVRVVLPDGTKLAARTDLDLSEVVGYAWKNERTGQWILDSVARTTAAGKKRFKKCPVEELRPGDAPTLL